MYGRGGDVAPIVPTAASIAILPNTGGNHLLFFVSLLGTVVGSAILASTATRFVVKKFYKA